MQLTKDDIENTTIYRDGQIRKGKGIDFSKFQQVVEFYEKYKKSSMKLYDDYPELFERYAKETKFTKDENKLYHEYQYWLFSYCFKDGLK